jgi:hypothetical protein
MMKIHRLLTPIFILIIMLSACAPKQAAVEEAVLTVGDSGFSLSELEALGTITVDYTNKDGETTTYSGVPLATLLENAGLTGSGTLVFTAADGYQADMALEEALGCTDCIVAIDDGSLRMVMPDLSSKLQVKDVIEISVN